MALMLAARCCCGTASNACSVLRTHPATNAPVETTVSGKTNFASPRLEGQTHVDELWYQHSAELPCLRPQTSDQTWAQSIRGHAPHPRHKSRRCMSPGSCCGKSFDWRGKAFSFNRRRGCSNLGATPPWSGAGSFTFMARLNVLILGLFSRGCEIGPKSHNSVRHETTAEWLQRFQVSQ